MLNTKLRLYVSKIKSTFCSLFTLHIIILLVFRPEMILPS